MLVVKSFAPDFMGVDIANNKKFKLYLHKGKVILLGFIHVG